MPAFDPSPWLLAATPLLVATAYLTYRGLIRQEFRRRGTHGWFRFEPWSLDWIVSTVLNLTLLAASSCLTYASLFHGSTFSQTEKSATKTVVHCDGAANEIAAEACSTD